MVEGIQGRISKNWTSKSIMYSKSKDKRGVVKLVSGHSPNKQAAADFSFHENILSKGVKAFVKQRA